MERRSHRIEVDGVTLHLEEQGQGDPLLLLHGFTGSTRSMAECADGLAGRHRVLSLDLIGHGRSDAPRQVAPYAMERCVEQIHGVLAKRGALPADVVGYSMGGRAALSLLARHPGALRCLVLVGASAGLEGDEERAARVEQDEALADRIERQGLERFVDDWMALPLFASQSKRLAGDALSRAREQRLASAPHGLANSLRGMGTGAQPPLHHRLGSIDTRVLFAVGDEDAKFQGIARDLAARMPRAEVAVVPDAGHAAHLENPAAFLQIATEFISTTPETP
jgi:2-succinyl-6-hydroxy-2,4-cyclohexadiene-1-carboxylate synthase